MSGLTYSVNTVPCCPLPYREGTCTGILGPGVQPDYEMSDSTRSKTALSVAISLAVRIGKGQTVRHGEDYLGLRLHFF